MLLTAPEILQLLRDEHIEEALPQLVDGVTLDVRLQPTYLAEVPVKGAGLVPYWNADPYHPDQQHFNPETLSPRGTRFKPGSFILAATMEYLKLPNNITAEFSLKSSIARMGIEHSKSGWIKPGFRGTITLELKMVAQYHRVTLYPGMPIGQLLFFRHSPVQVPQAGGRYAKQRFPQISKGVKRP